MDTLTAKILAFNPNAMHDILHHLVKIRLCCSISRKRIVRSVFIDTTVTSVAYTEIMEQFVVMLDYKKKKIVWP